MSSINKVILVGHLGRAAELKYTTGGAAVASFSVACSEVWNDKSGQRQERTEWVNVNLWGKSAESVAEYLVKGKQVYVEGKLQTDEYTDKDGVKRKATKVKADKVVLLGGGAGKSQAAPTGTAPFHLRDEDVPTSPHTLPVDDSSVPF